MARLRAFESTTTLRDPQMLPIADTIARASWHGEGCGDCDYDDIYDDIGGIYDSCDDYDYRSDDHDDR